MKKSLYERANSAVLKKFTIRTMENIDLYSPLREVRMNQVRDWLRLFWILGYNAAKRDQRRK